MWRHDATSAAPAEGAGRGGAWAARSMIAAVIAGAAIGLLFPDHPGAAGFRASDLTGASTLFLRTAKLLIAPLVFATLVAGIAGHGPHRGGVGTLAVRSIVYFEVVT